LGWGRFYYVSIELLLHKLEVAITLHPAAVSYVFVHNRFPLVSAQQLHVASRYNYGFENLMPMQA